MSDFLRVEKVRILNEYKSQYSKVYDAPAHEFATIEMIVRRNGEVIKRIRNESVRILREEYRERDFLRSLFSEIQINLTALCNKL